MKVRKHMISRVLPDSIAEELGLEPGDRLVSVNGQPVEDVFDYRYLMNEELVVLLVERPDGEEWELEVEKENWKFHQQRHFFHFYIYTVINE